MDPLSEVLSVLELESHMAGCFDHGGDWAIQFQAFAGIKCHAVLAGECWLTVSGVADPLRLRSGDCILLPRGFPFRLCSDPLLPAVDASTLAVPPVNGGVRVLNGGGDCTLVAGYFGFQRNYASILLKELPPIIHLQSEPDKAELHGSLDRMRRELREQRPGSTLIAQQLATAVLIQALRLHLEERSESNTGWLGAMTDPRLRVVIESIHTTPGHRWTLPELARVAGMSRSSFAARFKMKVGVSPLEYVTRWRMMIAGHRLKVSSDAVSDISLCLGYASETAFRAAFRKVMNCSPLHYRRGEL